MDLYEAWDALDTPAWVYGECTNNLIDWVQAETAAAVAAGKAPNEVKAVQSAVGLTAPLLLRPLDALLELAKATAPRVRDDVYDTYRHWGWLRYLGSLARGASGWLELSAAGVEVGGNQRRVLSEELGVGFGVHLATSVWARSLGTTGSVMLADVDVALADGYGWSQRLRVSGRKPDYLLLLDEANDPTIKSVKSVECKGTASPAYAWTQLAKAMTQLSSLTFDGVVPQGVAISTVSGPGRVEYLALDPEESEERAFSITTEKVEAVKHRKRLRGRGRAIDVSSEEMIATAVSVGIGSLADYAGNVQGSLRWLPPATTERLSRGVKDRTTVPTDHGDFRGVQNIFPTPDGGRLRVFQGIEASVDGALVNGRVEDLLETQALFAERHQWSSERQQEFTRAEAASNVISAVSSDGAVLQLVIE